MSPPSSLLPPCHRAVRMDEHYCSPLARLAAADSPRGRVTRVSLGSPQTLPSAQPSPPRSHASASPDRPVSVQGFTLTARLSLPGPHHAIGPDLPAARCEDARTVRFCLLGSPSGSGSAAVSTPRSGRRPWSPVRTATPGCYCWQGSNLCSASSYDRYMMTMVPPQPPAGACSFFLFPMIVFSFQSDQTYSDHTAHTVPWRTGLHQHDRSRVTSRLSRRDHRSPGGRAPL